MIETLRDFFDLAGEVTVRGLDEIKTFFRRDWTTAEKVLVILCCILLGVVKGFQLAKIKQGTYIGCNNGNYNSDFNEQPTEE